MAKQPYDEYFEELSAQQEGRSPEQDEPGPQKRHRRARLNGNQLMMAAAFVLAAVLLVVLVVMVFRSILNNGDAPAGGGVSTLPVVSGDTASAPPPQVAPEHPVAADPNVWNLWLVNTQSPVAAAFARPEMETITQNGVAYWFDARIVEELQRMMDDCNAAVEGGSLRVVSGFRSYERQAELYTHYYNNFITMGNSEGDARNRTILEYHEVPAGTSDHHTGLAVDFVTGSVQTVSDAFAETQEYQWLSAHCAEYGFVIRYLPQHADITGMPFAPYHFRYVGVDAAREMTEANLCLEQYVSAASNTADDGAAANGDVSQDDGQQAA